MSTPRRMSREARRASLLDAAGRVVADDDADLTFETVAERAGVSPTLPYKYFDSVDEIALELYARFAAAIDEATSALVADPRIGFDDKVGRAMDLWFDAVERDGSPFLRLTGPDAPAGLAAFVAGRRARAADLWAGALRSEFALDPTTAGIAAESLIAVTSTALRRWRVDRLDRTMVRDTTIRMARGLAVAVAEGSADPLEHEATAP